jgi:hypothetical protein
MLSNRQFKVFVEDKSSKFRFLNNGLTQGSVLSRILFNLQGGSTFTIFAISRLHI